jgi:hypothetical protein
MRRVVLAVLIAAGVAAAGASVAQAAAPRILLVSGGPLARPLAISDWERIFAVVSAVGTARALPRTELAARPRLRLSLFWGPRWIEYLQSGKSAAALQPRQADQHGSFYPAWSGRAAAIDLPWAGRWPRAVPARALGILARLGVPTRIAATPDPWAPLRRRLDLPRLASGAPCPASGIDASVDWEAARIFGGSGIGPGPVYPGLGGAPFLSAPRDTQYGGPWHGQKVFWYVLPSYDGPVLIRGRRLDGPEWMRFDGGRLPAPELRIEPGETVSWDGQPAGSRGRPSGVRVRASGCYGVQVDGTGFTRTIVFEVRLAWSPSALP